MGVVGRLNQYASMQAAEFDDYSMSENLVTYSNQFNDASWAKNNYNVTANATTAPDGTLTADKLIAINASTFHDLYKTPSLGSNTYTLSIFAKAAEQNFIQLRIDDSVLSRVAMFNLATGSVISSVSVTSPTITPYPNGWYRCSITVTTNIINAVFNGFPTSSNATYSGDGVSGLHIWEAQLERGTLTDYTPTTTTAINRVLPATTNTNITGLGTYYSSGFDENVGFTTFLPANISAPYDLVYDEFGGTFFGAGQGRYMRQYTDKSVIVYNEIDEITNFTDTDISFWTSNPQTYNQSNGPFGSGQETSSIFTSATLTATGSGTDIPIDFDFNSTSLSPSYIKIYKNSSLIFTYLNNTTDSSYNVSYNAGDTFYFQVQLTAEAGDFAILVLRNYGSPIFTFSWFPILD